MSKTLILCEKASVASDFAKTLKAKRSKGFFENKDYIITWVVGHLLNLDTSKLSGKFLEYPVFPKKWEYKVDPKKAAQFNTIKKLVPKADKIIIATDAGREGELIARLVLQHIPGAAKKKWYRFWTSESLEPEVIKKELKNIKPSDEFETLYKEALARQHADWLVGINGSKVVNAKVVGRRDWSVGRVQTPVLKLICERKWERDNFKPEPYWLIFADFDVGFTGKYIGKSKKAKKGENPSQIKDEKEAQELVKKLKGKEGVIDSVTKREFTKYAPPLFNLTALQREASKKLRLSASETANIAQTLYEKYKCLTYPRTSSRHLGEANRGLIKTYLKKIGHPELIPAVDKTGKRVFDDSKLSDHHALVVSKPIPSSASDKEKKVYELVKNSMLAVFMPPWKYVNLTVYAKVEDAYFHATEKTDLDLGWRSLYTKKTSKAEKLARIEKGDKVKIEKINSQKKMTTPPPLYTYDTLLEIMENVHKLIEDKELKKVLTENQKGLGTEATRAGILDNLVFKGYVEKKGVQLDATPKGETLIKELVKTSKIADPIMTADWEASLSAIRAGKKTYNEFINEIIDFVSKEVKRIEGEKVKLTDTGNISCPKCKSPIVNGKKAYFCSNKECNGVLWKKCFGKTLTPAQAKLLLEGKSVKLYGLKGKSKKTFNAEIKYDFDKKIFEIVKFIHSGRFKPRKTKKSTVNKTAS